MTPTSSTPACHLTRQDWGVPVRVVDGAATRLPLVLRGLDPDAPQGPATGPRRQANGASGTPASIRAARTSSAGERHRARGVAVHADRLDRARDDGAVDRHHVRSVAIRTARAATSSGSVITRARVAARAPGAVGQVAAVGEALGDDPQAGAGGELGEHRAGQAEHRQLGVVPATAATTAAAWHSSTAAAL